MLDDKDRENIALKKFSLISPVLNGQVKNAKEYFEKICANPIDMPYYGRKVYSPKTLRGWLNDYRRGGIDALKPGYRSDRNKSRKVSPEIAEKIREKRARKPRITSIMLYEELVKEGTISPDKLSLATFYRFLAKNPELAAGKDPEEGQKEFKRFSHQWVNELWQTDIMYGPYLKVGKTKKQTYLFAFIDDASRLVTHGQFFFNQNFEALRVSLKEAVLKRGVPKMIYTDNARVYRNGQFALICAGFGCSLIHAEPFSPNSKGKIERFFHTVRLRFLNGLDINEIKSLEELNSRFWQWLEEDYHRKTHSALGMSPLDFYMSQLHQITLFSDPVLLDELFLLRITRKVNHDATLSVDNILYETEQRFSGSRLEVRYDPQWLLNPSKHLLLYKDGVKVGEARQVNFHDNAHVKRKGRGRPAKLEKEPEFLKFQEKDIRQVANTQKTSISFTSIMDKNDPEKQASQERGEA